MLVTYTPDSGERREWTFRPLELTSREAEAIEDVTGWTFAQWSAAFYAGRTMARRAALWVLLRREQPTTTFDGVEFGMHELGVRYDGGETAELRRQVSDDPDLDDAQRAALLEQLGPDPDAAPADEAPAEEDEGKADATEPDAAGTSG